MRSLPILLLIGSTALAGCATSARQADVALPSAFEAVQGAPADAIALDRWWTAFNDPQLTQLVDDALARNTDARTAAARLQEARATRTGSLLQQFFPQGNLTGSARRTETEQLGGQVINIPGFSNTGVSEAYSANFDVSWQLDFFGRFLSARRAANAEVAASRFAYEAARANVAAQVADAYFQARGLAIQVADARETARIQTELSNLATRRAQAGLAASADADRIAGDLAQANAQVAALEAELQAQKRTLLILAGRVVEPTASLNVPPAVGETPPVPASIPSQLLARRPDVREAQARVVSAAGQTALARLAFLPTFTLTPGLGWSRNIQPGFESETANWSIGGAVSQPILDIPRLLAELRAQNARTEQAVIGYERAVQTAFQESEGALVRLDADRRRVALLRDGEVRAARAFEASRIGYQRGLNDLQTTLSAEQSWRATRTQLTSAQVQALRRAVQAYQALGGGWPAQDFPTNAQAR
ncbi:efflux transporter outer membrane subunit [Phenylobacterium deserti]|uniref:TolC family protein n=1 Tax=Phenylobacterium deserti TaxID=1914756 RepID=A0A328ATI6_9CAUL|nr:TolC family protein [Phenylobacterium deserti]RAK58280.1 TolC family protein [Phenylobacterium deserti]